MKETKLQPNELDMIESNNGLKLYLSGLVKGKSATPRSSLYNIKGKTEMLKPDEILARWTEKLSILRTGSNFEHEVFQFDLSQQTKWGPQGAVAPIADILEDIVLPSFSPNEEYPAFGSPAWALAKRAVVKKLHSCGCIGLSPVPLERVVDDMRARDTLESNSGWPLFTRRNLPEVVAASIDDARSGAWKTYPAIALFRNYNQKTRLVWMFPMSTNLVEGSFYQPLQSILGKSAEAKRFLSPWSGFEAVREYVSSAYSRGACIAASDFSSTDAHFKLSTSMEVCSVLEQCFQPRFRDALRESIVHMHTIPLVIGPDTKLEGEHGVSSGSNWTNFIETIFDWIFSYYVLFCEQAKFGRVGNLKFDTIPLNYAGLYAIGDDMSWYVSEPFFDPQFSKRLETYGKRVGQIIKAEKTTNYKNRVKSLQRLFQKGYFQSDSEQLRAVYSTIRALKSLVFPERMHKKKLWSKDMSAIRTFMILENCVDHPLFYVFCDFVLEGDPYLRTFARQSDAYIEAQLRQSKLIPGLNATYNQEKRDTKLSEFASVRYAREH